MNKQLNKLKHEAIRKGAAELVTYTLGYDGFTKGSLVQSENYPMFQESQGAYEEYWYECLDLNAIGFLGEEWFMETVTEALMERLQEMEYEFAQDVIVGAMEKAYLSLKSLEYDPNLETSTGDQ